MSSRTWVWNRAVFIAAASAGDGKRSPVHRFTHSCGGDQRRNSAGRGGAKSVMSDAAESPRLPRRSGMSAGRRRWRALVWFVVGLAAVDVAVAFNAPLWRTYDPDDYAARLEVCRRR